MSAVNPCCCSAPGSADCPQCRKSATTHTSATRWHLKSAHRQRGPHTWAQLRELANRGELAGEDQLLQEGTTRWLAASSFPSLFSQPDETPILPKRPRIGEDTQVMLARLKQLLDRLNAPPVAEVPPTPVVAVPPEEPAAEAMPMPAVTPEPTTQVETPAIPEAVSPVPATVPESPAPRLPWRLSRALRVAVGCLLGLGMLALYPGFDLRGRPESDRDGEEQEAIVADRVRGSDSVPRERWAEEFIARLNRQRRAAGLAEVVFDAALASGCCQHAKYLARHIGPSEAGSVEVFRQDADKPGSSPEGNRTAGVALVCYAEPLAALDCWMGRLFSRTQLLHPGLERIALGCERSAGGAWVCVVDPVQGRSADRAIKNPIVYPAPQQKGVACIGYDRLDGPQGATAGLPVSVVFADETRLKNVQAHLMTEKGTPVTIRLSTPEQPLSAKLQRSIVGIHPLQPLDPGRSYQVTLSAVVNGEPWRMSWSFATGP